MEADALLANNGKQEVSPVWTHQIAIFAMHLENLHAQDVMASVRFQQINGQQKASTVWMTALSATYVELEHEG